MLVRHKTGFTLLEMLLSVSLIASITLLSAPLLRTLLSRNDVALGISTLIQANLRAQILAQSNTNGGAWGVYASSSILTIFNGVNFATRNQAYDESVAVPSAITFSASQWSYSPIEAMAASTTLQLTHPHGERRQISISPYGAVTYLSL